jgi:hypothetical protein
MADNPPGAGLVTAPGKAATLIVPLMVTMPVAWITVPYGTVKVAPELTVKFVNCRLPL